MYYFYKNNIESFDDFSPYPYIKYKNLDNALLQKTLETWERPFNTHNEGYYNAEPNKIPPLVPLYDYIDMKNVRFPVYSEE